MELWSPPHDQPHLFEWWRPLLLASQQARRRRLPWPIHLDEFRLAGRVLREDRPDVWIYEHHTNGGSLCVDATGTTYRFIPTPTAKGVGQFRPCDIRSADLARRPARGRRAGSLPGLVRGPGAVVTRRRARRLRRRAPRGIGRGNGAGPRRAARTSHPDRWRWVAATRDGAKLMGCERSPSTMSPSTSTTSTPESRSMSTSWAWRNARTGPRTSASMASGSMPAPSRST